MRFALYLHLSTKYCLENNETFFGIPACECLNFFSSCSVANIESVGVTSNQVGGAR